MKLYAFGAKDLRFYVWSAPWPISCFFSVTLYSTCSLCKDQRGKPTYVLLKQISHYDIATNKKMYRISDTQINTTSERSLARTIDLAYIRSLCCSASPVTC